VCGAAVVAQGEAATQLLGDNWGQPQAPEASGTSPVWGGVGTEPVGSRQPPPAYQEPPVYQEPTAYQKTAAFQQPTAYHAPLASMQQTSPLAAPPPTRRGGRGLWFFALLVVFMLGAGVAAVGAFVWWKSHQQVVVVRRGGPGGAGHPAEIPNPPLPPDFGERLEEQIRKAVEAAGVGAPLDESGAVVSGDTTTVTKTYQIDGDATFALHAMNASVTVTGYDGDEAEVKVVKRGGSAEQRSNARTMLAQTDEGLTLLGAGAPGGVEVSYEVKVPRGLHAVKIDTDKGDVKISGFDGAVVSNVKKGSAEFRDVTGDVKSNVIKGETRVVFEGAEREGAQEFSVVKGDIEAKLAEGTDADISATTTSGDIDADGAFGLSVEKRPVGRALSGKLGDGGRALRFRVTSGDIKLKR
jgi:predicted peroxiredoxin